MKVNMIPGYLFLRHFERSVVWVCCVCVLNMCFLTSTHTFKQPSNSTVPRMLYPSKAKLEDINVSNFSVPINTNSTVPVTSIKPELRPFSSNGTGVCSSGPCDNVDKNISVNTNTTGPINSRKWNPEALLRASYVFLGLGAIGLAYLLWKSTWKKNDQVHRYGVIPNNEDMELAHIDSEDGEDDTTHFDLSTHKLK